MRLLAGLALAALASGCAYAGEIAVSPYPSRVGPPPPDLGAVEVAVGVPVGPPLAGWLLPAPARAPGVVLLHGVTDSRLQLVDRARFLHQAGYAVLLVDLPGHGESPGDRIGYGWRERHAAAAAVGYLKRRRPHTRVGVLGISLGGAAAALAPGLNADALVLEMVYPTFVAAITGRIRRVTGPLAPPLISAALRQVEPRIGAPPDSLRPIEALRRLDVPTFVIGGSEDPYTPPDQTRALYDAARGPKQLWVVEGGRHEDLHGVDAAGYERRVLAFLGAHLRAPAPRRADSDSL